MSSQKSYSNNKNTLYLVSTPIGNLEDMTYRAVEILKSVSFIFAEDTRVSIKLLNHFNIKDFKIDSYHNHNEENKTNKIIELLKEGNDIALISDAGMPIISDPGYKVVKEVISNGYNVVPLPGANAALTGLIASGITPYPFTFYGFLDQKQSKITKQLQDISSMTTTSIIYESSHRISKTLSLISDIMSDRQLCVAREITKKYEEFIRGTALEIIDELDTPKGEFVIIIEGNKTKDNFNDLSIIEHVKAYIKDGFKTMDAIKQVAKDRGIKKNEVYNEYHK